jgi:hypothetical protein
LSELDELAAELQRGIELQDEQIITTVHKAAAVLEEGSPGRVMSLLTLNDARSRARRIKEAAARERERLAARGELYRPPPPAIQARERRLPDRKDAVPLYVDTHALLTLLAARENGFAAVDTRTVGIERRREVTGSASMKFQISPLDLLKLGPEASGAITDEKKETASLSREMYQTEGSLLYQLLESLQGEIAVVDGENWDRISDFHFVELHARLRPNPWVAYLTAQRRLVDIAEPLASLRGDGRRKAERTATARRIASYRAFLDTALNALEQGGPLPLLGEIQLMHLGMLEGKPAPRVVVPVFPEYVRDPSLAEVTRGVVAIIGTVREKLDPPAEPERTAEEGSPAANGGGHETSVPTSREAEAKWARAHLPLVPSAVLAALSESGLETVFVAAEELSNEVRRSATLVKPDVECPPIVRGPALEVAPLAILASQTRRIENPRPEATEGRTLVPAKA